MTGSSSDSVVIVCPLAFERRMLERARLAAEIICCGPGADNLVSWAERFDAGRRLIVLAGLAGALRETAQPGSAYLASTVVGRDGRQYRSAITTSPDADRPALRAVIATAERCLTTRKERESFADKTSADLVDLESGLFAEAATILGWRWAIVRGVSDGHQMNLPPDIDQWVDDHGRPRAGRIALSLLRSPWFITRIPRLRADATAAMNEVARVVRDLIDQAGTSAPSGRDAEPSSAADEAIPTSIRDSGRGAPE